MSDHTDTAIASHSADDAGAELGAALRPVAITAAREQARLEARAGRTRLGAAAALMGIQLRHLGSDEAARSGLRYQPMAWTAIAIVAIAAVLPGTRPNDPSFDGEVAQARRDQPAPITPTTAPAPYLPPTGVATPTFEFTFAPPPPQIVPPFVRVPGPTTPPTPPPPAVELAVRAFGWASSLSGTGLSSATVPAGRMPVGARLNQLDKVSFVRLAGTTGQLVLEEDPAGARQALGSAKVRACPILDASWREEPDQDLSAAPEVDAERCVEGVEDADTWTFDLSGFANRAGPHGFALLPGEGAPADFQITFRPG